VRGISPCPYGKGPASEVEGRIDSERGLRALAFRRDISNIRKEPQSGGFRPGTNTYKCNSKNKRRKVFPWTIFL